MKSATAAALAIIATGQFYRADLYDITLQAGGAFHFTTADAPLTVAGTPYLTGLIIRRSGFSQRRGLEVDSVDIAIAPQTDNPAGAITIGGVPFLQACRNGLLDGATVQISKIFLSNWRDTTPGAIPWFKGKVNQANAGRQVAQITVDSDVDGLNLPMPRNVWQTGCLHTVFDSGCTLLKASFTTTGATTGSPTATGFNTGLTQADDYFALGVITFTSGPNNGLSRVVKSHKNASGAITLIYPLPTAPGSGDTFSIIPGCDKAQATCSAKFSNLAHFRGMPYVPNPETPYDGGAANNPPAPTSGAQNDVTAGSKWSSSVGNTYIP